MLSDLDTEAFLAQKASFDLLIDARSPREFSESHIQNARNFYALNDAEHKEVGTLYKQVSRNDAKVLGARYICQNVAKHLEIIAKEYKIGSKIGIYCAKGGLRSSSIAIILSNIGYRVYRLQGGYKNYRQAVLQFFEALPHHRFIVLGGNTGCGKSELIQELSSSLDLEGAANHLGSSFGSIKGWQPSQKAFENTLFEKLRTIDKDAYIFIEGESKRIGKCTVPNFLYERMQNGYRVEITAPIEARVERILKDYHSVDSNFFYHAMGLIAPYVKKNVKEEAISSFEKGELGEVARILLVEYYDLVYKKPSCVNLVLENAKQNDTIAHLLALSEDLLSSKMPQ